MGRAVAMALAHDIVEIDAGDTFAYDPIGLADRERRETAAAERLFGMLPDGAALRALWEEFDAGGPYFPSLGAADPSVRSKLVITYSTATGTAAIRGSSGRGGQASPV